MQFEIFPDDVYLVSYPKSGKTWLRFLLGNYLNGNQTDFPNSYQSIVPDTADNVPKGNLKRPRFIQSHWSYTPEFPQVVYLVRDGRDVAVSYYFHFMKFRGLSKDTNFKDFLEKFHRGVDDLPTWSRHANVWLNNAPDQLLIVRYEDMKANTLAELIRILEFASIPVNIDTAQAAVEAAKFENLKAYEGRLEQRFFANMVDNSDLSIKFFRKGETGEHKAFFNQKLMQSFIDIHGIELERFGYIKKEFQLEQGINLEQMQAELLQMQPLPPIAKGKLEMAVLRCDRTVNANSRFNLTVSITNNSNFILNSYPPNPVYISYQWFKAKRFKNPASEREYFNIFPALKRSCSDTYKISLKAPHQSGEYVLRLTLEQKNVRSFDKSLTNLVLDFYLQVEENIDMIEANNPKIDVDELMDKVREEAAKRQNFTQYSSEANATSEISKNIVFDKIKAFLGNAELRTQVRSKWPDQLERFPFNASKKFQKVVLKALEIIFRDQREVNSNLIQAFNKIVLLNRNLFEKVTLFQSHTKIVNDRLNQIDERIDTLDRRLTQVDQHIGSTLERCNTLNELIEVTAQRLEDINHSIGSFNNQLNTTDARLGDTVEHFHALDDRVSLISEHINVMRNGDLVAKDTNWGTTNENLQIVSNRIGAVDVRLRILDQCFTSTTQQMQALNERLSTTNQQIQAIDQRHTADESYLKNDLTQQKRLITLFLEEAYRRLPEPFTQAQLQTFVAEKQHLFDACYVAFEDRFRGSREEILERFKVYLPLIEQANLGTHEAAILDVGCGRGEWLELLRTAGYIARGLDANRVMIDQCKAQQLDVIQADVISHLQALPEASIGAITGFHIIEHFPFSELITLITEVNRVVKPGGLAIFETPNPKNLVVGACNFYSDPTHQSPIFPDTIQWLLEMKGFSNVEIMYLNPVESSPLAQEHSLIAQTLDNWFFGPRDYAVIGRKL